MPDKINVFHPQPHAFHDAHATPINKPQHESGRAIDPHQNVLHFLFSQDNRKTPGCFRADNVVQPWQLDLQYLLVEK